MNETIELAHELKKEILNEPLIVEYLRIKKLYQSNRFIFFSRKSWNTFQN